MGKIDTRTKKYIQDPERFAELFNVFVFDGENVVNPNRLVERDTVEIIDEPTKSILKQKARDAKSLVQIMTDENICYLLLGVENQTDIHYAMPVRVMVYDAANYDSQIDAILSEEKQKYDQGKEAGNKNKVCYPLTFPKNRKIFPVITLVLYWGSDEWDAPRSLHEMIDPAVIKRFGKYICDYKIHVVCPYEMTDAQLSSMKTELRSAMELIKYSKDPETFDRIVAENAERYSNMDAETARLVNDVIGTKFRLKEKDGKVNMCEAIEKIKEEAANKKEVQDIKISYEAAKELNPDMDDKKIIRVIAKKFKTTMARVSTIVA